MHIPILGTDPAGLVKNTSGAVVANANVDIYNLQTNQVFNIPTIATGEDINGVPANIGKITSTVLPARIIQLGLKYSF